MKRIYINEAVCIGCHLCEVYCELAHSQSKDLVKAFTSESPRPLPAIRVEERRPVCFAVQCRHCDHPVCVYACLTGALQRHPENGTVTVDIEKCISCWTCILACPFGAIARDTRQGKVVKCDLCTGKDMPACVANCPNEALVYAEAQDDTVNDAMVSHLVQKRS
jgi:carbon-monoxide dehydrogenase iron sulfur subunit